MNRKKDVPAGNTKKTNPTKQKTVAVKSRIKGAPPKRQTLKTELKLHGTYKKQNQKPKSSVKDKPKGKPAPIIDPGYSLYSGASDHSTVSTDVDTCTEVLARLKERRKVAGTHLQRCIDGLASSDDSRQTESSRRSQKLTIVLPSAYTQTPESMQSETNAPFNLRLTSSTPDPEKALNSGSQGHVYQTVPERDHSGPIIKETSQNKAYLEAIAKQFQNRNFPVNTHSTAVPFNHYKDPVSSHGNPMPSNQDVINTSSSGFVPMAMTYTDADIQTWAKRDSDIQTYQAYIPRESTGFAVQTTNANNDSKNQSSGSSGAKEVSHLISKQGIQSVNSSGTDYVVLPWPQGNNNVLQPGTPVYQLQNGLFQIRPSNTQNLNVVTEKKTADTDRRTPSPNPPDLGGSYIGGDTFQIPEKDKGPSVPQGGASGLPFSLPPGGIRIPPTGVASHEILSSISGTNSPHQTITPLSQRTASTITPRTESSANMEKVQTSKTTESSELSENGAVVSSRSQDQGPSQNVLGNKPAETECVQSKTSISGSQNESKTVSTNISLHGGQGQLFMLQAPNNTAGSHSSSFQLIPVSFLPGTNLNTSGIMTSNQQSMTSSQGNKLPSEKEAEHQKEAVSGEITPTIPNPWSKVKMDAGLKKLRYLLKELKECGKISKDVEVSRLAKDVEKTVESIPTLSSTFNLMAEIDLCLQPLRNENCQLRRKIRLVNQQIKERESVKEKEALNFDVVHLQASNTALQKQVKEEKETKVKLALELKDLHSQIQRMKIERNKLLAALSEKETDELKIKQECLSDTQKFRHEIEQLQRQTEGIQLKHEALEKENHILRITLQQRDSEINKMQDVVSEVKECVASLIQELEETRTGDKSFVSNNSFSLQKLMRVLGEDSIASFSQSKQKEKRPQTSQAQPPTPRLTKHALATHNKIQTGGRSHGYQEGSVQKDLQELKASNSDTEVELNVDNYSHRRRKSPVGRRGQSLSPPSKRAPLREKTLFNTQTVSSKQKIVTPPRRTKVSGYKSILNRSLSPSNERVPKVAFDFSKTKFRNDSDERYCDQEHYSNIQQSCNQSEASRYSVTDYFQKYPLNKTNVVDTDRQRHHSRSYSQPNFQRHDTNYTHLKSQNFLSPETNGNFKHPRDTKVTSPQDHLYQGTCLDNSLSAINDDNFSSVSGQSVSTATTVNDTSFRRGIAALDANILKLQLALQKTKSMLS